MNLSGVNGAAVTLYYSTGMMSIVANILVAMCFLKNFTHTHTFEGQTKIKYIFSEAIDSTYVSF